MVGTDLLEMIKLFGRRDELTVLSRTGNGLLIMVYATGSNIDHELGPAVNGLLGLEGGDIFNVTAVS